MTRRLRTIRVRLTLWYVAVFAVILALFAGAVYFTIARELRDQLDDSLRTRTSVLDSLVSVDAGGDPQLSYDPNPEDPNYGEEFERLFDSDGTVVADNSSDIFGSVDIDELAVGRALQGESSINSIGGGRGSLRVFTSPVIREGAVIGVLQVGDSKEDLNDTLHQLLLIFAVALPAAVLLASLGGWWIASRALSPIDRLTRAASAITGGSDLRQRVAIEHADDEVGRLARTFNDMIARLDRAFERQRRFSSDASHELRTPLTALRGQIDVALARERAPGEYRQLLGDLNAQVERMSRLVEGLLMLARGDGSAPSLNREPLDAQELVESVADQMRPAAEQKGLRVVVRGDGRLTFDADEDLTLQLLLNLADNAVKYTPQGEVTIGWRGSPAPSLYVADTGAGIAPEQRERIFERFHRGGDARSAVEGVGLGLAISRWIADAHGWTFEVSGDGAGTTFTVHLGTDGRAKDPGGRPAI